MFIKNIFKLFLLLLLIPTLANAQGAFPLSVTTATSDNKITVTVKNITRTTYSARVILSDKDVYGAYTTGNNQAYTRIVPNTSKQFIFTNVVTDRNYEVHVLATVDATPNPMTSQFSETKLVIKAKGAPITYGPTTTTTTTTSTATSPTTPATTPSTTTTSATQTTTTQETSPFIPTASTGGGEGSCIDGIDNDGDGRYDYQGATISGTSYPPDPSCVTKESFETVDGNCKDGIDNDGNGKIDGADKGCKNGVIEGSIIPCEDKCDLNDVFRLINNLIEFLIKAILFPIIIFMFIYAGYQYITAEGNPAKTAKLKSLIKHIVGGLIIILCAWLIVKTLMLVLGYTDSLLFFG